MYPSSKVNMILLATRCERNAVLYRVHHDSFVVGGAEEGGALLHRAGCITLHLPVWEFDFLLLCTREKN